MPNSRLRNSLMAILAFTVAAILIVASAFAADTNEGKSKRRFGNGQLNTGMFQVVVPKANRNGSGRKIARILAPKSDRTGCGPITAQFVPPKAECSRCRPRRSGLAMAP